MATKIKLAGGGAIYVNESTNEVRDRIKTTNEDFISFTRIKSDFLFDDKIERVTAYVNKNQISYFEEIK